MKQIINGERYMFVISFFRYRSIFYFEIRAIDQKNKTASLINNVNCILSQFDINADDNEKMEPSWEVKEKEGKRFFQRTIDFISDNTSRKYLEKQLNLDQELGEWNKF